MTDRCFDVARDYPQMMAIHSHSNITNLLEEIEATHYREIMKGEMKIALMIFSFLQFEKAR